MYTAKYPNRRYLLIGIAALVAVVAVVCFCLRQTSTAGEVTPLAAPVAPQSVVLTEQQAKSVKVEALSSRSFSERREAVGYIDFDQDRTAQITPQVPGTISEVRVTAGQDVQKNQVLYTITSPDLLAAESTLISSAGTLALTTRVLERASTLYQEQGVPQKELDQAQSDHQAAEGAYHAARDAMRVFGKSDAFDDQIIASHKTDPLLPALAPFSGRIVARNASVGTLVQPGMSPAPMVIADIGTMWLLAEVSEADLPAIKRGQKVQVTVDAYPGRVFAAEVSEIGASIDPSTRRSLVRCEIVDAKHELRPQMFAHFVIQTGAPFASVAVPSAGLVREGDGTNVVFVTADHRSFTRRPVEVGMIEDGYVEVRAGLAAGEMLATDGALFLSNALATANR